jgi:hypothetical protein
LPRAVLDVLSRFSVKYFTCKLSSHDEILIARLGGDDWSFRFWPAGVRRA